MVMVTVEQLGAEQNSLPKAVTCRSVVGFGNTPRNGPCALATALVNAKKLKKANRTAARAAPHLVMTPII